MATAINSPEALTKYLNEYQSNLASLGSYDPLGGTTVDKFMEDKLGMGTSMPEAPKYLDMFKDLRDEYNLGSLESSMNEYKDLIRKEELMLQQQRNYLRSQPVRMGVIEGRTDKATRDRQEQISWYSSELQRTGDMVTSAYNMINLTMQFTQMDYEAARDQYQTEFNNRLGIYQTLAQEARDQRDFAYKVFSDNRAIASTNLSMYADMIAKGNLSWESMDSGQKAEIAKMETMVGLPVGFLSKIQLPAGHDVVQMIPRDDGRGGNWLDIIYRNPDGTLRVENVKTGSYTPTATGGSSSSSTEAKQIDAFWKSLKGMKDVVATAAQRREYELSGKSYLTREHVIQRLVAEFPTIARDDIARAVYDYWPDK